MAAQTNVTPARLSVENPGLTQLALNPNLNGLAPGQQPNSLGALKSTMDMQLDVSFGYAPAVGSQPNTLGALPGPGLANPGAGPAYPGTGPAYPGPGLGPGLGPPGQIPGQPGFAPGLNSLVAYPGMVQGMQPLGGPGLARQQQSAHQIIVDQMNAALGPDTAEDDADEFTAITDIKLPEFLDVIFALTGVSDLQFAIQKENLRRTDETYSNPYMEVEELVVSLAFELLIAGMIVFNSLVIGIEATIPKGEMAGFFNVLEHFFTLFFFIEWCLRVTAFGWVWVFVPMNAADSAIVFGTGVFLKWFCEPMGVDLGNFRTLTVLRIFRLVRLAKRVRLKPFYKPLWILIQGLATSAKPLMWAMILASCVLYVFSIAATEFVGRGAAFRDDEYAQLLFGDFMRSMFTMVQMITMDTYCDLIIRPLMKTEPFLALFFILFVTIGVFIVMNLITAMIVNNAFRIVSEDKDAEAKEEELKKKKELKKLSELFMEMDQDCSGELTTNEFFGSLQNKQVIQLLQTMDMRVSELEEVWDVLDDGDGLLTIKEFTDGIRRMKGAAKAKDIADVIKKLHTTDRKHQELKDQATRYAHTLHALERDTEEMARDTEQIVELFKEMYHRLSSHIHKGERADRDRLHENNKIVKLAEEHGRAKKEEQEEEEDENDDEDGHE